MNTQQPIVYSAENCPKCESTKMMLERNGIEYQTIDLTNDEATRQQFRSEGVRELPVVKFGDKMWTGFRMDRIREMIRSMNTPAMA